MKGFFFFSIDRQPFFYTLINFLNNFQERFCVKCSGIFKIELRIRIQKNRIWNSFCLIFLIGHTVDIRVNKDIDKILVKVIINLFISKRFIIEDMAPMAPLCGKKQKKWFLPVQVFLDDFWFIFHKVNRRSNVLESGGCDSQ